MAGALNETVVMNDPVAMREAARLGYIATRLAAMQPQVCCIDGVNPPPVGDVRYR
ncbi:hypothetical protein BSLA_03f0582 [Burkholderia stabilis]|nr:hypothetical protein BSLA_03f0582 [Burkholderia stabilis]